MSTAAGPEAARSRRVSPAPSATFRWQHRVTEGAAICAVNVGGSSFVFSKGKAKINRSHKFSGKLADGHGDSMTITGLAKPARVTGSFVDQIDRWRLRRHDVQLRQGPGSAPRPAAGRRTAPSTRA